jgi:hypothetical protein
MADPLLAQSAMDRLQSAAYELVVEGESYRQRRDYHRHRGESNWWAEHYEHRRCKVVASACLLGRHSPVDEEGEQACEAGDEHGEAQPAGGGGSLHDLARRGRSCDLRAVR